jgi:uncharacterized protein (UPF0332 family)
MKTKTRSKAKSRSLVHPRSGRSLPPLTAEVREFCKLHSLLSHLKTAVKLAKESFHPVHLVIEIEHDPESAEEWLVVRVVVRSGHVKLGEAYRKYATRWTEAAPWPALYMIRISYDVS